MVWKKIAGRGKLGDMNWGASLKRNKEVVDREIEELKKHIGEIVLLTGGGGTGYQIGILKKVWLYKKNGCYCPQVKIVNLKGVDCFGLETEEKEFTPFIDSWQISVWVENVKHDG